MKVSRLLEDTRSRLAVVPSEASLRVVAFAFKNPRIGLVVVVDNDVSIVGVVTKSDIVHHLASGGEVEAEACSVMSRQVTSCTLRDDLHATYQVMKQRNLQSAPVLNGKGAPLGVLDLRDALGALLNEQQQEDRLLIDYIQGVGYW